MRIRNKELRQRRHRKEQIILAAKKERIKNAASKTGNIKEAGETKTSTKPRRVAVVAPKSAAKTTKAAAEKKTSTTKKATAEKTASKE